MNLLVIGGGGREHAIVRKLKENPEVETIYCLPGNGGIAADAVCVADIGAKDIPAQVEFAKAHRIDYAVVAPDDPLALGAVDALSEAGCTVKSGEDDVFLQSDGSLRSIRPVRTAPYPGFPTDAQPVLMAALLKSAGSTVFVENIFENRYRHVDELARMGAEVRVAGRVAVVTGREHLHGARVKCTDLRAGAALVIAGLQADGLTRISRIEHIDRGYESIERDLYALGAHVRRETGT
jgi:UDP-N-acetylglucosamine enolpyruvyl transferase